MKSLLTLLILVSSQLLFAQTNDTITTKSGLKYFITQKGNGKAIDSGSIAIQHYTVWLSNGKKLDSSRDRNQPFAAEYPSKDIIKGTNEALSILKIGDRGIFIMPYYLAYGEKGRSVVPPKETLTFDIELLDSKANSLSKELEKTLYQNYKQDSVLKLKQTIKKFYQLKKSKFKDLWMDENELNTMGYGLLGRKHAAEAAAIFKLNTKEYPKSFNVYDSLGEAYMDLGENKLAILNYKKSLALNPKNENATKMLEKLNQN
ncbi:MAG: FKBP-type peptidyl-prolyl cis-trans isomerase [Bacteroidetes bacterium]|nr:FKBP-type peptidyl-prolyl cis-trans isomerase [Bacteroidota bacterium]MBU1372272.1 FKBP-type peptidyl-prolyl cis-trans isomerase [Bacteroidota bacterium]MBU1486035.1 FKBP-type peptidyl-prolyl cis-trans isomerase [Bacteroidota bacterium]MBU1761198.1 FKBP-type peptidyl-prolyl cis-trans isomerase [Bacteroidota bacterium]MBU2268456.1 FKBP-type peptidyl-prolyl cis-trans isomerase [Bacteroidota bacterium]